MVKQVETAEPKPATVKLGDKDVDIETVQAMLRAQGVQEGDMSEALQKMGIKTGSETQDVPMEGRPPAKNLEESHKRLRILSGDLSIARSQIALWTTGAAALLKAYQYTREAAKMWEDTAQEMMLEIAEEFTRHDEPLADMKSQLSEEMSKADETILEKCGAA